MSLTGVLARGFGLAEIIGTLAGGADVTLGTVSLGEFESPESMGFGGEQKLTIHEFANGARVVDAMGASDRPIEFQGEFFGAAASAKARAVDLMRSSGKRVSLAWGDYYREVVIQSAELQYTTGGYRIPYQIRCVVVPVSAPEAKPSLIQQLKSDITDALGITDTIGPAMTTAASALQGAQAALPLVGALTKGGTVYQAAATAVGGASTLVGVGMGVADNRFAAAASGGAGLPAGGGGLATLANLGKSLAGFAGISGFTDRAAANVQNAGA